jgi:hypothetical protein
MDLDEFIIYLQKLQAEGKGNWTMRAHNIDINTAHCGNTHISENENLYEHMIDIDSKDATITIGSYSEYYSY